MTIDAVAVLPLSIDSLRDAMRVENEEDGAVFFRVVGRTMRATPLEGGTLLHLGMRFDTPHGTLGAMLRKDLDAVLGDIDRVYVFPSVAKPEATSYTALLEELGEGGEWISVPEDAEVGADDALGVLQSLAGGLGPDLMNQVQSVMSDPDAMAQFSKMAEGLMGNADMRAMLEQTAASLQRGDGDVLEQAQEMARRAAAEHPDLLAGLAGPDDSEDEEG